MLPAKVSRCCYYDTSLIFLLSSLSPQQLAHALQENTYEEYKSLDKVFEESLVFVRDRYNVDPLLSLLLSPLLLSLSLPPLSLPPSLPSLSPSFSLSPPSYPLSLSSPSLSEGFCRKSYLASLLSLSTQ